MSKNPLPPLPPATIETRLYTSDQMRAYGHQAATEALMLAPMPVYNQAARDMLFERYRQVSVEGWTPEHDDEHRSRGMAVAAACYALAGAQSDEASDAFVDQLWPWTGWAWEWWKPKDERHNLIRAGALILAEIERLDRAQERASRHAAAAPWIA